MYNEIKSCVTVNGCPSGFFKCQQGVRQGANLSPLLFSVYLNDLDYFMNTSGCKGLEINIHDQYIIFLILFVSIYADNTLVLSDIPKDSQDMLNVFNEYCKKWKLNINIDKTKAVIFVDYTRNRAI